MKAVSFGISSFLAQHSRLQVNEDGAWYMFAVVRLGEESVERVITAACQRYGHGLILREVLLACWRTLPDGCRTIAPNAMLEAVQFPACVAYLRTGLSNVNADALAL